MKIKMAAFINGYDFQRLILLTLISTCGCKTPLYIVCLNELTDLAEWMEEVLITPQIAQITLDKINKNNYTNLLEDYELRLIIRDVQFTSGFAAKVMMEVLSEDPPKVALFGPTVSDILAVTAQIAPFFNIIEVGCYDTAASLANAQLYPTLFTVNYILNVLNPVFIKMTDRFHWSRIGTIANPFALSTDTLTSLHDLLVEHNKTLVSTAVHVYTKESASEIVKRFKQNDIRIILMSVMRVPVHQIFCQAYHENMYGPGYVWIIIGPTMYGIKDEFSNYSAEETGCTLHELYEASAGHFMLNYDVVSRTDTMTTFGELPSDTIADLSDKFGFNFFDLELGWLGAYGMTVDSMWAIALGLNNSIKYLDEMGLKLHDYNYSKMYLDAVMKGMSEVNFNGVSGAVSFSETGQRVGISYIQKSTSILNNSLVDVARFDPMVDELEWLVPPNSLWLNGKVPMDRFMHRSKVIEHSGAAFAVVIILDVCGIGLALGFLVFNIYYRNNRSVKMSSPLLNNVILAGSLLMYLEVVIASLDYIQAVDLKARSYICMLQAWFLSFGFTTIFGALFSKTYRVYVIFRNYKLKRKHIQDLHLFAILIGLVVVDVVILLPWSVFHPMIKTEILLTRETLVDSNVILSVIYHYCYNPDQGYYLAAVYVYKGLLLAFGTFLAWETRGVTVPELNDSKLIGLCIYNVVVVCIFGVPLAHVLSVGQATLIYVLESCLIIFCTTICLCIIFVPKLQARNQVQTRFVTEQMSQRTFTENTINIAPCSTSQTADLKASLTVPKLNVDNTEDANAEIKKLRMQIAEESIAISKLRRSLKEMTGNIHFYKSGSEYVLFKTDSDGNTVGLKKNTSTKE